MRMLLGREAHPVALALTLAALSVVLGFVLAPVASGWRIASVGYALAVAVLLTVAWVLDRRDWTRAAMLLSIGLWSYLAAVAVFVIASPTSALLACAWGSLAFGSYLLEVANRGAPGRRAAHI